MPGVSEPSVQLRRARPLPSVSQTHPGFKVHLSPSWCSEVLCDISRDYSSHLTENLVLGRWGDKVNGQEAAEQGLSCRWSPLLVPPWAGCPGGRGRWMDMSLHCGWFLLFELKLHQLFSLTPGGPAHIQISNPIQGPCFFLIKTKNYVQLQDTDHMVPDNVPWCSLLWMLVKLSENTSNYLPFLWRIHLRL